MEVKNEQKQNIATYAMKMMKPFTLYANRRTDQVTSMCSNKK